MSELKKDFKESLLSCDKLGFIAGLQLQCY